MQIINYKNERFVVLRIVNILPKNEMENFKKALFADLIISNNDKSYICNYIEPIDIILDEVKNEEIQLS